MVRITKRRIKEEEVARILNVIANPPPLRQTQRDGDVVGDFDEWFEGGARRKVTGYTLYQFDNGIKAIVHVFMRLHVSILFPDGTRVLIRQEDDVP